MTEAPSCSCKVGRNIDTYDLEGLNDTLKQERRESNTSLRDLATIVNQHIVESIFSTLEVDIIGDAESLYTILVDDESSAAKRVTIEDQLASHGVSLDELLDTFVSYQSVRYHFQNCLDISTSRQGITTVEEGEEVLVWARNQHESIVERTLTRLDREEAISIGSIEVMASPTVSCDDCGSIYRAQELLEAQSCACPSLDNDR